MSREWPNQLAYEDWKEKLEDDESMAEEKAWEYLVQDDGQVVDFMEWLFDKHMGVVEEYLNTVKPTQYEDFLRGRFDDECEGPEFDDK